MDSEGKIFLRAGKEPQYVMDRNQIALIGLHNVANVLAALSIGAAMGLEAVSMREAVEGFRAVEHRLEWVAEVDGVQYYNDSKATNLESVRKALESFNEPLVLIAGGRDKRGDWGSMREFVAGRVRGLVMIGEATSLGMDAWGDAVAEARTAQTMEDAVRVATGMAGGQGLVLLSPGCSSYDMFENFEQRGQAFCSAVKELAEEK